MAKNLFDQEQWARRGEGDAYVRSLETRLAALEVATADTGWIAATLLNSWLNYDTATYPPASYRKVGNQVFLKGLIKSGTTTNMTIVLTLPAGFRPSREYHFPCVSGDAAVFMRVHANGNVTTGTGWSVGYADITQSFWLD